MYNINNNAFFHISLHPNNCSGSFCNVSYYYQCQHQLNYICQECSSECSGKTESEHCDKNLIQNVDNTRIVVLLIKLLIL